MRHDPALVNRVAMKASGELVVNATARHFHESGGEDVQKMIFGGTGVLARPGRVHVGMGTLTRSEMRSLALILINQQINHGRMRKFRRASKPAVSLVKHLQGGIDDF